MKLRGEEALSFAEKFLLSKSWLPSGYASTKQCQRVQTLLEMYVFTFLLQKEQTRKMSCFHHLS